MLDAADRTDRSGETERPDASERRGAERSSAADRPDRAVGPDRPESLERVEAAPGEDGLAPAPADQDADGVGSDPSTDALADDQAAAATQEAAALAAALAADAALLAVSTVPVQVVGPGLEGDAVPVSTALALAVDLAADSLDADGAKSLAGTLTADQAALAPAADSAPAPAPAAAVPSAGSGAAPLGTSTPGAGQATLAGSVPAAPTAPAVPAGPADPVAASGAVVVELVKGSTDGDADSAFTAVETPSLEQPAPAVASVSVTGGSATARLLSGPAGVSGPVPATAVPDLVSSFAASGGGRVSLALTPEGLGQVVVTVSRSSEGISVTLRGTADACAAVGRGALVDALSNRGLVAVKVDLVAVSAPAAGQGDSQADTGAGDRGASAAPFSDRDPSGRGRSGPDGGAPDDTYAFWS
jgi:hypothetical protein